MGQVFNPWGPPPNDMDIDANFLRKKIPPITFPLKLPLGMVQLGTDRNLDEFQIYSGNSNLYLLAEDSLGNTVGIGNWLNSLL